MPKSRFSGQMQVVNIPQMSLIYFPLLFWAFTYLSSSYIPHNLIFHSSRSLVVLVIQILCLIQLTNLNLGLQNASFLVILLVPKVTCVLISTPNTYTLLDMSFLMSPNSLFLFSILLHLLLLLTLFHLIPFGFQINCFFILAIIPHFQVLFLIVCLLRLLILFHLNPVLFLQFLLLHLCHNPLLHLQYQMHLSMTLLHLVHLSQILYLPVHLNLHLYLILLLHLLPLLLNLLP